MYKHVLLSNDEDADMWLHNLKLELFLGGIIFYVV